MSVRVDTGPLEATHPISRVARERWPDLVQERRTFLTIHLPYDCRCLLQFVEEAADMVEPLGYTDTTDFLRRGLALDPALVDWALQGLKRLKPDEAIPFERAVALGRRGRPRRGGQEKGSDTTFIGRGASYILARLQRDKHADLLAQVYSGEISANAAAEQAGYRKRKTLQERLRHLWTKATEEDRLEFRKWANL